MSSREELERALLSNPFNVELRTEYAHVLLEGADAQAALAQFELLLSQSAANAAAQVGAALALLQLGRESEALQRYASARNIPGFTSDPTLESRLEKAKPAAPARFSVVQGGKSDTVVNFVPPAGRERIGFADIAGLEDLK